MKKCTPLARRVLLGMLLGTIFGTLCFTGFLTNPEMPAEMVKYQEWSWSNPMLWVLITSRLSIGFVVGVAGLVTIHPVFKFKMKPWFRGTFIGALISLPSAFGGLMGGTETGSQAFWYTLIAGAIIGMIIDYIVTKAVGEGEILIER